MDTPRYTHDCDHCTFLGTFQDGANYDLYVHVLKEHPALTTVVARWGSDGSNYTSGLRTNHPALVEAERRATEKGLLQDFEAWDSQGRIRYELAHMIDVLTGRTTYNADSLLGTKEVALLLHVSEATIKRWTDAGKLQAIRSPGGHRKIRLADVAKYALVKETP